MLEIHRIDLAYGKSRVLSGVSLQIGDGEAVAVLGRNGVGKTTLLKGIMGLLSPQGGTIVLDGRRLDGLPPHRIARAGLAYAPQDNQLFLNLSIEQNLFAAVRDKALFRQRVEDVLRFFPALRERYRERAEVLSGGQRKFLAIARALITHPKVILLDEPSEGIQPTIVQALGQLLRAIVAERRCGLLLVEQNRRLAMSVAQRGYLMDRQTIVEEGDMQRLEQEGIIRRYMAF
jgi:branched-chain amino acid transport system ATP-binding protein